MPVEAPVDRASPDQKTWNNQALGHVLARVPLVVLRLTLGGDAVPHGQKCSSLEAHVLRLLGDVFIS